MGQQQLLLIVLGVIIVGIAVVVGINLFNTSAEESTKDTLVSEGTNLGALAQQYYKKPSEMGGGGGSFVGFTVPANLDTTISAVWAIDGTPSGTQIKFKGTPKEYDGWTVGVTVTADKIQAQVNTD
ncbi:MAG: hypothetical protein NZM09_03160 [Ignavibacterium sp.]|nr:hypothetical protein [Ignavibacterium sp.]MCX7612289.1 hypothetical protein [Ignavibacterium sp.]MDW8374677.1 hypothetical protein [Ignavibacteriales bacterium]